MFGGQVVLIILNAWCLKMFLSGYGNLMASGYGFTKFFVATLCLIGFCKITFKLDSYMSSLGINLGRPTSGIGALGLLMAAGRVFSHVGKSGGTSEPVSAGNGSNTYAGEGIGNADAMAGAGPIPMTAGIMDDEVAGMASTENGFDDVTETPTDMDGQEDFGNMSESMDDGVLGELGAMQEDFDSENPDGLDGDMSGLDSEIPEMAGVDSDMAGLDGGNIENLESDSLVDDGTRENAANDNNDLFGNETGTVGDLASDYPVEEDLENDGGEGPEMDLENGSVGSGEMEGEAFGSASSSFGESEISSTEGASNTESTGNDVLGELSGTGIDTSEGANGLNTTAGITPEGNYAKSSQGADAFVGDGAHLKVLKHPMQCHKRKMICMEENLPPEICTLKKEFHRQKRKLEKKKVFEKKDIFKNFLKTDKSFARKRNQKEMTIQQKRIKRGDSDE